MFECLNDKRWMIVEHKMNLDPCLNEIQRELYTYEYNPRGIDRLMVSNLLSLLQLRRHTLYEQISRLITINERSPEDEQVNDKILTIMNNIKDCSLPYKRGGGSRKRKQTRRRKPRKTVRN
jgi:hypothetical protein